MANLSTHVIRSNIIFIQNNICRYRLRISTSPIPEFPQTSTLYQYTVVTTLVEIQECEKAKPT